MADLKWPPSGVRGVSFHVAQKLQGCKPGEGNLRDLLRAALVHKEFVTWGALVHFMITLEEWDVIEAMKSIEFMGGYVHCVSAEGKIDVASVVALLKAAGCEEDLKGYDPAQDSRKLTEADVVRRGWGVAMKLKFAGDARMDMNTLVMSGVPVPEDRPVLTRALGPCILQKGKVDEGVLEAALKRIGLHGKMPSPKVLISIVRDELATLQDGVNAAERGKVSTPAPAIVKAVTPDTGGVSLKLAPPLAKAEPPKPSKAEEAAAVEKARLAELAEKEARIAAEHRAQREAEAAKAAEAEAARVAAEAAAAEEARKAAEAAAAEAAKATPVVVAARPACEVTLRLHEAVTTMHRLLNTILVPRFGWPHNRLLSPFVLAIVAPICDISSNPSSVANTLKSLGIMQSLGEASWRVWCWQMEDVDLVPSGRGLEPAVTMTDADLMLIVAQVMERLGGVEEAKAMVLSDRLPPYQAVARSEAPVVVAEPEPPAVPVVVVVPEPAPAPKPPAPVLSIVPPPVAPPPLRVVPEEAPLPPRSTEPVVIDRDALRQILADAVVPLRKEIVSLISMVESLQRENAKLQERLDSHVDARVDARVAERFREMLPEELEALVEAAIEATVTVTA